MVARRRGQRVADEAASLDAGEQLAERVGPRNGGAVDLEPNLDVDERVQPRRVAHRHEPGRGPRLAEGMVLAIEPMVNAGKPAVKVLSDGWTAVTRDRSLSAHFEHTVAVTADGPWILTARELPVAAQK